MKNYGEKAKKVLKKNLNAEEILNVILISAWIFMGIILLFYILFGCKSVLNSDSSFIVDYSLEQIRTSEIFPTGWYETNDFWIYSLIPLITVFIKSGFSLFLARQSAVLIQTIVLFILLFKLFYDKNKKSNFLIPGLIIISGISGQILFEVFGDATYGTIIVYMLLTLYFVIKYLSNCKKRYLSFILISLTLLTMCSLRFPIYITAPLIVVLIYLYIKNGLKKEYIYLSVTLIVSTILGYILNKYLQTHLLYVSNFHRGMISSSEEISANIRDVLYQCLWLLGATNSNIHSLSINIFFDFSVTSPVIILTFVRYIFCLLTIAVPILLSKKLKDFSLREQIIYIYTVALTVIISFFLLICNMSIWYRYLVPVLFFLSLLYIYFYKYFLSEKRVKIIFVLFISLFCIFSLYMNISTYYSFSEGKIKDNPYQGLTNFLLEHDLTFGFAYSGIEHNLYTVLSNGQLMLIGITDDSLKPFYWLTSDSWFDKDFHSGKTFFIRPEAENIPHLIKNGKNYEEEASEVLEYNLYDISYKIFVFENNECFQEIINTN